MTDDIVTRLRAYDADGWEAADEIVRLRAEVERLTDEMSTMHRSVVHRLYVAYGWRPWGWQ